MSKTAEEIEPGMREIRPGVWRLRVYAGRGPNGSPIQITRTVIGEEGRPGGGIRKARAELAKLRSNVAKGQAHTGTETMGGLLDRWLAHCESKGLSPTTMRKYHGIAEKVVRPELGQVRLSKLTAGHLDRLYAKLTAKGNEPTTVRRVHALVGTALHAAERWDLVDRNVARRADPPPVRPAQITAPSPAEVQAILTAADELEPGLATLLLLAALTGARRGELCALRWSDLDTAAGTLTIARSVYETAGGSWGEKGTKSHQVRKIGLDPLALEALRRHREAVEATACGLGPEAPTDAFMFSRSPAGSEPVRPDVVTKVTKRAADNAGVDTHLHAYATSRPRRGSLPGTTRSRSGRGSGTPTRRSRYGSTATPSNNGTGSWPPLSARRWRCLRLKASRISRNISAASTRLISSVLDDSSRFLGDRTVCIVPGASSSALVALFGLPQRCATVGMTKNGVGPTDMSADTDTPLGLMS